MAHHRQVKLTGDLNRKVERDGAAVTAGALSDTDLDTDDQICMFAGNIDTWTWIEQPKISTFTDHHRVAESINPWK